MADMQSEGLIKNIALTNFDTEHLVKILDAGINIVSNQVQYSMIDRRPANKMARVCTERGVKLLTYGTVAGGLLTERYLGTPEPGRSQLNTWSLGKYKRVVDEAFGSWESFQGLLKTVKGIADKHNVGMANVAVRYILDKPEVGGVIIGARLGVRNHIQENLKTFSFALDETDMKQINGVLEKSRPIYGDCGDEYRK